MTNLYIAVAFVAGFVAGWHLRHEERDGELVTVPVYGGGREVDV